MALDVKYDDTLLGVLPFFHIYGLGLINVTLYRGATCVVLPRSDFVQCVDVMSQHNVTSAPVVPPIVRAFATGLPERPELPNLRVVLSGAAPLDEAIAKAAAARLGCPVVQGYGLTETSPVTHATRLTSNRIVVAGVGPPVPNTDAKIVNVETGMECEPRQHGEICVRGPQVMKGYLNRAAATAETIDGNGWLHTGDIGYADEDGCFFVVDRVKGVDQVQRSSGRPCRARGPAGCASVNRRCGGRGYAGRCRGRGAERLCRVERSCHSSRDPRVCFRADRSV